MNLRQLPGSAWIDRRFLWIAPINIRQVMYVDLGDIPILNVSYDSADIMRMTLLHALHLGAELRLQGVGLGKKYSCRVVK